MMISKPVLLAMCSLNPTGSATDDTCWTLPMLVAELMENDDMDPVAILQGDNGGSRLPLGQSSAANRLTPQRLPFEGARCPMQPAANRCRAQRQLVLSPPPQTRATNELDSPQAAFTPPDQHTNMRAMAAHMPEHLHSDLLGSRYAPAPPVDTTRLPPRHPQPQALVPIAPSNAETAGLLSMYHMSRAGLAEHGIFMPVSNRCDCKACLKLDWLSAFLLTTTNKTQSWHLPISFQILSSMPVAYQSELQVSQPPMRQHARYVSSIASAGTSM